MLDANELESRWATDPRWAGVRRDYTGADVVRLRGSVQEEHTLARIGARKLWDLLTTDGYVNALGTLTGGQAVQSVKAGLRAIYVGGWQIAADANLSGQTYPDLSLYPANSVPQVVRRINNALLRHDQIAASEGDTTVADWMLPILADAEAGFGGPLNAFELMKSFIAAGAAGVHWEDQLATQMKTGPQGGKVLVPTSQHLRMLNAARLATDVCDVPTIVMARTDAHSGAWLTSDVDERDRPFLTGERSPEGYHRVRPGVDAGIARALAYAPYSDLIWMETANPDLAEARKFAEAVRGEFPDQALAFNCYPGFDWTKGFDRDGLESYQRELGAMGFRFQFITAAGYHSLNHSMFDLAASYRDAGVAAYADLQQREYASEAAGFTATKGARDVGMGYFDLVSSVLDPQA